MLGRLAILDQQQTHSVALQQLVDLLRRIREDLPHFEAGTHNPPQLHQPPIALLRSPQFVRPPVHFLLQKPQELVLGPVRLGQFLVGGL